MVYAQRRLMDGRRTLRQIVDELDRLMEEQGLPALCGSPPASPFWPAPAVRRSSPVLTAAASWTCCDRLVPAGPTPPIQMGGIGPTTQRRPSPAGPEGDAFSMGGGVNVGQRRIDCFGASPQKEVIRMGITNSNKVINADRIDCDGSLKVTLALTAAPDIITHPHRHRLVLDRSGSMTGPPLTNMKTGSKTFIDIISQSTGGQSSGEIGSGSHIGISALPTRPSRTPS